MYKYVLTLDVNGILHIISFTARDDMEAEDRAEQIIAERYEGKCTVTWVSLTSNYDPRNS